MEAKNFRIGNLVNYVTKDKCTVSTVDAELLCAWADNYRMYKPITLTDEWLEKLGFYKQWNAMWTNKMHLRSPINGKYEFRASDGIGFVDVTTVHQLQNLFFAMTGTELQLENES